MSSGTTTSATSAQTHVAIVLRSRGGMLLNHSGIIQIDMCR